MKLSKQHGVNPCIPTCFFCHKEKNEVALLGELPHDMEAPKTAILDYEPCDDCRKILDTQGIGVIAVKTGYRKGDPFPTPIQQHENTKLYPTGDFVVIREEALSKLFEPAIVEQAKKMRILLIDHTVFHEIFQHVLPDGEDK